MSHERFDQLRERLLHAGIAPRHVRRYVAELRDHFDDLIREETANGLRGDAAEDAARARIGSEETLAQVMLARPELRSVSARFPWLVFGLTPLLVLAAIAGAAILIEGGVAWLRPPISPPVGRFLFDALNWLVVYAAPLMIAAALGFVAEKQRTPLSWLLLGLAVICIVGGCHEIGVKWSPTPALPNELYAQFLGPQYSQATVMACVFRASMNAAIVGAAYLIWRLWLRRALGSAGDLGAGQRR